MTKRMSDKSLVDRVIRLHVDKATVTFMPAASLGVTQYDCLVAKKALTARAKAARRALLDRLAEKPNV